MSNRSIRIWRNSNVPVLTSLLVLSRRARRNQAVAILLWIFASAPDVFANDNRSATDDPPHYIKQPTWQASMLASLEALARRDLKDGFAPFQSGRLRGGQPPERVSVSLDGAEAMYLFVTGDPDIRWGVANWADAQLLAKDGTATPLNPLTTGIKVLLGRHEFDLTLRAGLYQKMRLGDRQFDRGLHVQANSVVMVPLQGRYDRFEAWIGLDAWAGTNGQVRFGVAGPRTAARQHLWEMLERDFTEDQPRQEMRWEQEDRIYEFAWHPGDWAAMAQRYAHACQRVPGLMAEAAQLAEHATDSATLERVRQIYGRSRNLASAVERARRFDFDGLRLALQDLEETFPNAYPKAYLTRSTELARAIALALANFQPSRLTDFEQVALLQTELEHLKQQALLANPLLDFERLLVIERKPRGDPRRSQWEAFGLGEYLGVPRQSSWNYGTMPNVDRWTNQIATLSPIGPTGQITPVFQPKGTALVADVDLHWDADKLVFSMPDQHKNWQICEVRADGTGFRWLTPGSHPDVHHYDPIYLPNGEVMFLSTAPLQGVPCNASVIVGMLYKMGPNGEQIRQITFEQDHDYTPSVLNDGRVLYLRWDYTDTPHVWNRLLMSMNPDGTGQMECYGANSYWPNAIFFARAIPQHNTKIVGIVTGHHEGRVGELVIFDPAQGRHETSGVVQRIPGRGQSVQPAIEDKLTEHSWPKFLHPWPLSEKHFLVACKPEPHSLWGIYLVDIFDNMVLVKEQEGSALLEPVPFLRRPKPPVIPDKTRPSQSDALVYMLDVYREPGLLGVPPGTVKSMRLFTYHFGYQTLAGIDHRVGADGPWEAKRVLGTVPVEKDGSALFRIPAKTPISFQPLDAEGKAVALMRSWMSAMPGENVTCVGCHDRKNAVPPAAGRSLALTRPPSDIQPWHGPARGFSFAREVQPVLDRFCAGCHNGEPREDGKSLPDLRREQGGYVVYRGGVIDGEFVRGVPKNELLGKYGAVFEPSYVALRQYVRVGGLESDLHQLPPMEFHANTSELIQMLQKGHHNVQLDPEAWDRLATWIDLNAPSHGTWREVTRLPGNQRARRLELQSLYGGVADDGEVIPEIAAEPVTPILPEPVAGRKMEPIAVTGWPFGADEAQQRQTKDGPLSRTVDLGDGTVMEFVRIPAGAFVMGDATGEADEQPLSIVRVDQPFWMSKFEVSNEQFARFNPEHDSRFEHRTSWIFSEEYLGWPLNRPQQPVVRVSWTEALSFCDWLAAKLDEQVTLPSEAQWEYACRAGSADPFFFGGSDTDFSRFANMGDVSLRKLAAEGWRPRSPDLIPRESRFDDGALVTVEQGRYQPNAWGLHDMHGNAAEWTRSHYQPYPYRSNDGRETVSADGQKVVRGGSWRDRPKLCRSGFRLSYPAWQKVYNVGFRVIIEPPKSFAATDHR